MPRNKSCLLLLFFLILFLQVLFFSLLLLVFVLLFLFLFLLIFLFIQILILVFLTLFLLSSSSSNSSASFSFFSSLSSSTSLLLFLFLLLLLCPRCFIRLRGITQSNAQTNSTLTHSTNRTLKISNAWENSKAMPRLVRLTCRPTYASCVAHVKLRSHRVVETQGLRVI